MEQLCKEKTKATLLKKLCKTQFLLSSLSILYCLYIVHQATLGELGQTSDRRLESFGAIGATFDEYVPADAQRDSCSRERERESDSFHRQQFYRYISRASSLTRSTCIQAREKGTLQLGYLGVPVWFCCGKADIDARLSSHAEYRQHSSKLYRTSYSVLA